MLIAVADAGQAFVGKRSGELDLGAGRFRSSADDVLHFFDVDSYITDLIERMGEDAGAIAMPHDDYIPRPGFLAEVDAIGDVAGAHVLADDPHGLLGNGILGLPCGGADVVRAANDAAGFEDGGVEGGFTRRRFIGEYVEAHAQPSLRDSDGEGFVVHQFRPSGVDDIAARGEPVQHGGIDDPFRLRRRRKVDG